MDPGNIKKAGGGYWGRILHVYLGNGELSFLEVEEDFYRDYLGGIGLATRVLWDVIKPGVDPLGPDNVLAFTTGLLTDTGTLFTGRFSVAGKSPLTGGWGDSNCGGYFAPALKRCGVDALFIQGKSSKPVYLYIDSDSAEIKDASHIWGMDAVETENFLSEQHGKWARVACIGTAGERLSRMAGICTDKGRLAARSGLGCVMGAKGLKAVVAAGRKRVPVNNQKEVRELSKVFRRRLEGGRMLKGFLGDRFFALVGWMSRKSPLYMRQPAYLFRQMMAKFGTSSMTTLSAEGGDSPVKNWAGVGYRDFPVSRSKRIGAEAVSAYEVKKYGCFSCPLRCGGILNIPEGPYPIEEMHKPEYETLCAFGTLLLNDDLYSIFKLNDLLNRAGMDSVSCGGVVAFAIECFEKGILTAEDTGGIALEWGDSHAILKLTEMIIERQGLGDLLADGVLAAARKIGKGAKGFAVHCGGMEPPMHDPKFDPGFGMAYHCEPAPSRHMVYSYMLLELERLDRQFKNAGTPPALMSRKERFRYDNKAASLATGAFFRMLVDCVGACAFGTQIGGDMPLIGWINAVTGWNLSDEDCLEIGERVEQLRHLFNIREGINPVRDYKPHPRIIGYPPFEDGPAKGISVDTESISKAYCEAMGWNPSKGMANRGRLERLGLDKVPGVKDLFSPSEAPS